MERKEKGMEREGCVSKKKKQIGRELERHNEEKCDIEV